MTRPQRGLFLGVAAALIALALVPVGIDRLEMISYDVRMRWRLSRQLRDADSRVLIVAVDDKTVGAQGYHKWPLPRGHYVPLVRKLQQMGVRCLGIDLVFEAPDPEEDAKLAAAMQEAGNVYFGVRLDDDSWAWRDVVGVGGALDSAFLGTATLAERQLTARANGAALPPAELARAARAVGSVTVFKDADSVLRHFPLVVPYDPPGGREGEVRLYASLPLLLAADLLGVPLKDVRVRLGDAVEIGPQRIPINASGEVVINYYGEYHKIHQLSFIHVVQNPGGFYRPEQFRNRAVILGTTVPGGFDSLATPYTGGYPGVEAEATVLQNILDGSFIRHAPPWVDLLLPFAVTLLVGAMRTRPAAQQAVGAAAVGVMVAVAGHYLLSAHFVWVSVACPTVAVALAWALVGADTYREAQWERARAQGAVETLAEVTQAIAHVHAPRELLPALERGIERVLGARHVQVSISDEDLRERLLMPPPPDGDPAGTVGEQRLPLVLRGRPVGHLVVHDAGQQQDAALAAATTQFAALALENSALFEESRSQFLNLTHVLAEIIEARDTYTAGHCSRVMEYACAIAERLGIAGAEMEELRYAALLHDVGKAVLDSSLLNKPGALSGEEMDAMRRHAALGRQWLQGYPRLRGIAQLVASHHERWDGTGYPDGLKGEEIPLGGRILAVADVWDALTTDRPYRKAMPFEAARQHIQYGRGSLFDARAADAFLAYLSGRQNEECRMQNAE